MTSAKKISCEAYCQGRSSVLLPHSPTPPDPPPCRQRRRLVLALITPRLYYCNSVFAGLPQSTLEPLQSVQNAAARLVFDLHHRDHVSPYLMQLHWLPVRSRVQFKLCTLTDARYSQPKISIVSLRHCTDCCDSNYSLRFRSSATMDYVVPRTLSNFRERAFAYAGPAAWNRLPDHIRRQSTPATFRRHLKTFFIR